VELPARADVLTGETVGDSSEFSMTMASMIGRKSVNGRIADIVVKGQEFRDVQF